MATLFDLMAKITLDTSGYERGLDSGESKAKTFGKNVSKDFRGATKIELDAKKYNAGLNTSEKKAESFGSSVKKTLDKATKLAVDTKEYDKGITGATAEAKTFGDAISSAGKQAESAQSEISNLGKQYATAQEQIDGMTASVDESARHTDTASQETKEFADGLEQAERNADTLGREVDELGGEFNDLSKDSGEASEGVSMFSEMLKANLVAEGIKAAIDGLKKLGEAVVNVSKSAIDSYANYEQLVGGVDTLFGNASIQVQRYASEAYKTAGLSANEYMETVTSFSASLLQSLDGDTRKAAQYADMAIRDMSDNANKMGTDMGSIQVAYQGFAKQNYSMLDNLKLGYGGTQQEMFRLLQTAASLNTEFSNTANFSLDNKGHLEAGYADIVQAIHIVQENMGITGTTAEEAEHTITGSLASVKAAWENLLTGISGGGGEFDNLVDNFVGTLVGEGGQGGALENLVPRIQTTLQGIGKLVESLAPVIADELPGLAESIVPAIGQSALSMIMAFGRAIYENAPKLLDYGAGLLESLSDGLAEGVPVFLENALPMLVEFSDGLREKAGVLVEAGLNLLKNLAQGIADGLPALIENIPQIVTNIANIINDNAPKILIAGLQIIITLAKGIIEAIPVLIANIPKIAEAIFAVWSAINWVQLGTNLVKFIVDGIKAFAAAIPNTLKNIGETAIKFFTSINWAGAGGNVLQIIANAILTLAGLIPKALLSVGKMAVNAFMSINWASVGLNILKGIANGITSYYGILINTVIKAVKGAFNAVKNFLGIRSPSRLFRDRIGKMMALGLGEGFSNNIPVSDMVDSLGDAVDELEDFEAPSFAPDMMDTTRSVQSFYVPDNVPTVANPAQMGYNGGNNIEVIPGPLNRQTEREITVNLYFERDKLAHTIFTLGNEEAQRVGLNLVGVN